LLFLPRWISQRGCSDRAETCASQASPRKFTRLCFLGAKLDALLCDVPWTSVISCMRASAGECEFSEKEQPFPQRAGIPAALCVECDLRQLLLPSAFDIVIMLSSTLESRQKRQKAVTAVSRMFSRNLLLIL